jgi:hypothetical protein
LVWYECVTCIRYGAVETTVTIDTRGGKKIGAVIGDAPGPGMPVPILEVTKGGQAEGKLHIGHHIFAINGQSAKGMTKREAHKAIKLSAVVEFTFAAVTSSGSIGGGANSKPSGVDYGALDKSHKRHVQYAIPDGSGSSAMYADVSVATKQFVGAGGGGGTDVGTDDGDAPPPLPTKDGSGAMRLRADSNV